MNGIVAKSSVTVLFSKTKSECCVFTSFFFITFSVKFVSITYTLKCLSIGTPKTIHFPFVSNGKLMVFRCPYIQAHYN